MKRSGIKSSLFKKLFISYGLTMVIGFVILAILLLQLFDNYFIENKKQLLIKQGQQITEEVAYGVLTGRFDQQRLKEDLQILDEFLNARIWIVNEEGIIYGVSGNSGNQYFGSSIDKSYLDQLSQGRSIYERGTFRGMLKEQSLTVGYPIVYMGVFRGCVLIHAPLPEVQKTFKDIYRLTILGILISVLLAYGVLYIQIKRISNPLEEISEAAKIIAGGEFQKRLKIDTRDEIEELGKSFNYMAESLEKIEENRRNLIANISHDLRSPMTSIRGFIEGILDGTIPEEKHMHYLGIVLEESKRLIKITNDLMVLSNMQQGNVTVHKLSFEVNEILRRALASFEQKSMEKKLKVTLFLSDEETLVHADKEMTERIVLNLLENAVKFTPEQEQIIVKTRDKNDKIWIEIKNTGTTIPENDLKKIWDRFYKGDYSRGQVKSGFGLGLSIIKEMVGLMQEKIWVESVTEEKYVAFTFTLSKTIKE